MEIAERKKGKLKIVEKHYARIFFHRERMNINYRLNHSAFPIQYQVEMIKIAAGMRGAGIYSTICFEKIEFP